MSASVSRWQKVSDACDSAAEFCNVGIVAQVLPKILGGVLALAAIPWLNGIAILTDPMIYLFRAAGRLTRVVGRRFFDVRFRDDPIQLHDRQFALDMVAVGLFVLTIAAFIASATFPPLLFVAWALGLSGIGIVYEVDYRQREKDLLRRHALSDDDPEKLRPKLVKGTWFSKEHWLSPDDQCKAATSSRKLYLGILAGLGILLLCSSATLFAPLALIPVLTVLSQIAGAYLAGINTGRVINVIWPGIFGRLWNSLSQSMDKVCPRAPISLMGSPRPLLSSTRLMHARGIPASPSHTSFSSTPSGVLSHDDKPTIQPEPSPYSCHTCPENSHFSPFRTPGCPA